MQPIGAENTAIIARNADHRKPSGLPFKLFRHVGENSSSCTGSKKNTLPPTHQNAAGYDT